MQLAGLHLFGSKEPAWFLKHKNKLLAHIANILPHAVSQLSYGASHSFKVEL